MTPDMTTRYYGHKREMASSKHTLSILNEYGWSMARVWLEYGWSMARDCNATLRPQVRECLEAGKKQPRDCIATPHSQGENATLIAQGDRPRVRAFRYVVCLLLLMVVGVGEMWGQTDYSGTYYLANNNNDNYVGYNHANNFYLCAAHEYLDNGTVSQTANSTPFLTTYKTGQTDEALWIVEKVTYKNKDYYTFKQKDGENYKYITVNDILDGYQGHRRRVHLEQLTTLSTRNYFTIEYIHSKSGINGYTIGCYSDYKSGNNQYLNPPSGNQQSYTATENETPPSGGIVGFYTKGSSSGNTRGSVWFFEVPKPIMHIDGNNTLSFTCADEDATFRCTIDSNNDPTTNDAVYTNTTLTEGVHTIKVIAVNAKGHASGVVTYKTRVFSSEHPYLISNNQSPWTVNSESMYIYYMIPSDNNTVNTTSMPRPSMEWYIDFAEEVNGERYFYFRNAKTGGFLYLTGTTISMKTSIEKTSLEEDDDNGFKFYLIERTDGYSIVPYGETAKYLNKDNGNNKANSLNIATNNNASSWWNFTVKTDLIADLNATLPFTPSIESTPLVDGTSVYYKIKNGQQTNNNDYYIIPPTAANGNAIASMDAAESSMSWYFIQVQAPTNDDWLTYYKIIHAETGKALYYNYVNNNSNCLKTGDYDGSNDNYKFAFVKSPTTDYYHIVPKSCVNDQQVANIYTIYRDNANIKPATTRAAGNNSWTFTTATLFCNNPEFVEEEGVIKIKCNTNAANIYINTESNTDPDNNSTPYAPTPSTQNWATTDKVRIKAIAIVSDGTNTASSEVITLLNIPDITLSQNTYTYNGTERTPEVTVSIGSGEAITTAPTSPATYTVTYNSSDRVNAQTVPFTVTDADANDNWYIWNVPPQSFTINKAPLTATADNKTVSYGDAIPTYTATYTGLVNGETDPGFTTAPTFSCDYGPTSSVSSSYTITISGGIAPNYEITTYNTGTLTVNPAEATVTADNKTKTYGETDPVLTATVTGLKNGDATSVISYTISRETGENAGDYTITPAGDATQGNYTVTYVTGTLTVNPAKVTLTANSGTETYDRTEKTVSGYTCNIDGLTFTEVSASRSETNAGTYEVTFTGVTVNTTTDDSGNYIVAEAIPGTLTINPKTLTITPDAGQYKGFGDLDPVITYTYNESQLVSGDVIGFDGALGREEGEDVGLYEITLGTLESTNTNYALAIVEEIYFRIKKSIGNGTIASGFTLEFGENTIILMDGETVLEEGSENDYTVSAITTTESGRYSQRTFNGVGNYTGYFTLRNANVTFQTDADRVEWSATFVAEPVGEVAPDDTKGHALPEGITAYIITDIMGDWAIPEPLNYIPEGIPVLLISNKESTGFKVDDASGHKPITTVQKDANMLKEVTTSTHFNAKTIYLLYKNEFVYNMDGDLAKGKVYLDPTTSTSPAPRLRINWDDMTSITELQNHGTTEPPNDNWYTLDGRKLNKKPTQKGMYLVNGKKVVIR